MSGKYSLALDRLGRRNWTEEEISDKLPGYQPHESRLGYYFDSPTGRVMCIGGHPNDQAFGSEKYGIMNISAILEFMTENGIAPVQVGLDQGMIDHVSQVEINPEWVRKISAPRLRDPIVMIVADDGMNVLDGHHRLAKHIAKKSKVFPAWIVPADGLERFQMRMFRQDTTDQSWVMFEGAHPGKIARIIAAAKAKWTPQNIVRGRV